MLTPRRTRRTAAVAAAVTAAALLTAGTSGATASTGAPTAAPAATSAAATGEATAAESALRGRKIKFKGARVFATGTRITIKGKAPTRRAKRVVVLTEKKGRKWVRKGTKRTSRTGVFTFKVQAGSRAKTRTFKVTAAPVRGFGRTAKTRKVKVQHVTGVTAAFTPTNPVLTTSTVVSGAVTGGRPAGRTVTVQMAFADGWTDVASGTSNPDGSYAITLPANWLYSAEARVVVAGGGGAVPATSGATPVSVSPNWTPPGLATSWTHLGGQKFRWNPCAGPITYRVNLNRAPLDKALAERLVHEAIAQVSAGTGLQFQYLGASSGIYQPEAGLPGHDADTKLLIGWALDSETTMSFKQPGGGWTVGWGGGRGLGGTDAAGAVYQFERGGVVLDAEFPLTPEKATELLMHEIGHSVGMGHAPESDPAQIMFPMLNGGANVWGAGDLTVLRDKSRQSGCIRPLGGRGAASPVEVNMP